jgi:nucleoside-diphosphate-sugar epimerase
MKIALTNNLSFMGKKLEIFLRKKNHNIISFEKYKSNYTDFDSLKKKLKLADTHKIDILIHNASISENELHKSKNIVNIIATELRTLEVLTKICKLKKIKKFILINSESTYGKNIKDMPFKIEEIASPSSIYGALKVAMGILGSKLFNNFISIRLFNVYGPNDLKFGLSPIKIDSSQRKFKNIHQVIDATFYKDLNNLIYKLISSKKRICGIFNLDNNDLTNQKIIIKKTIKLKNKKTFVKFGKID